MSLKSYEQHKPSLAVSNQLPRFPPKPTPTHPDSPYLQPVAPSTRSASPSSRNSLSIVSWCSRYGDRHRRGGASTACLSPTKQPDVCGALSGALAVILSFGAEAKQVVLIHGSWSRGEQLAPARAAFEERGYTAHTPTLRHPHLPSHEGAMIVASLGRVCREADSRWCMARKARQALSGAAAAHNPQRTTVRLRRPSALQPL